MRTVKYDERVEGLATAMGGTMDAVNKLAATVAKSERRQGRLTLRAAATRIPELIVEKHLQINRETLRNLNLYSVDHAVRQARLFREKHPSLPPELTAEITETIAARAAAMQAEHEQVMGAVATALGLLTPIGDSEACTDPADDEDDWSSLAEYATLLYGSKEDEAAAVRDMLRAYVELRSSLGPPLEPPAPDPKATGLWI